MPVSGSVTLNTKVNSEEAERRLQAMTQRERELGAAASQSASAAADSYGKLTASQKELQRQSESLSGDLVKLGANLSIIGVAALEAKEHLSITRTVITGLSIAARGPLPIVAGLAAVVLAAKSASDALTYLSETAIPAAGRAEAALASLRLVTERTGGNVAATTEHVNGLEDALTSLTTAAEATRTLNTMGISLERQREVIDGLRDGIVAMGGDVNTQLPQIVRAIKQGNSELLDNAGVVSTIEMMYRAYAAQIGKSTDALEQHERDEAIIQGILKETAKYAGSAAAAMQTYEGRVAALRTEQQKAAKEMGELVLPFANLGTEAERLGVAFERHIIRRLKEIGSPATGLAHDAKQALMSLFNQDYLIPRPSAQQQGEADMVGRTIKKYQAANAAERARQQKAGAEGGYGPANITDLNKFYEEKAKREQADRERAEREAEQHAEAQKRQRQQLQNEIQTIGKEGRARELADLKTWYDEQLEIAQGNKRNLEMLHEAHRKRLQEIDKKFPPLVMGGVNSSAPGLGISMGGAGKLNMGSLGLGNWKASQGSSVVPEPVLQKVEEDLAVRVANGFEEGAKTGLESGIRSALDGDMGGLGDAITGIVKNAVAKGLADKAIGLGKEAIVGGGGLMAGGPGAMLGGLGFAAASASIFAAPFMLSKWAQDRDQNAINERFGSTGGAEIDRAAIGLGKLGDATYDAIDAQQRFALSAEDVAYALENSWRQIDQLMGDVKTWDDKKGSAESAFERYMVRSGKMTEAEVGQKALQRSLDWKIGNMDGSTAFDASKLTLDQLTSIDPKLLDPNNRAVGSISQALGVSGDVAGQNTDDRLLEAIKLAFDLKATEDDEDRVMPGATPDRPLYSSIVNFKDMMAFFAPGEMMRAQGPGTRRADGMKGRAVNTRAV